MEDFNAWWTPERIAKADTEWLQSHAYEVIASKIRAVMEKYKLKSVIELGCGAGYVGSLLNDFDYTGIDGSLEMVTHARSKNPGIKIWHGNIRQLGEYHADLVGTFAVLKHFSNADFPEILKKVLACGTFGLFEMQVAVNGEPTQDNPEEGYHHTWTSTEDLYRAVDAAGHEVLDYNVWVEAGPNKEIVFVTTTKKY